MMKRPMTPRGYAKLRKECQRLKAMRPQLAEAIEVARAHGDLSENADYDAAKERSGLVEAKIRDLDAKLANAEVIDPSRLQDPESVVFGVTVDTEDLDSGESKTFTIVGEDESDVQQGLISLESPIGRSLIGKQEGDVAKVQLPGGSREFEIMEIRVEYSAVSEEVEEEASQS
ncbi:transcription elongation factor GreA [bacterium]|nr:transcription elongation factor GreA [bacterium]